MSIVSQGQSRAQMVHPVHRSQSTRQIGFNSGRAGLGIFTMQSTGQTVMQASHPVQPFSLMIAFGRGLRGFRAGGAAALAAGAGAEPAAAGGVGAFTAGVPAGEDVPGAGVPAAGVPAEEVTAATGVAGDTFGSGRAASSGGVDAAGCGGDFS